MSAGRKVADGSGALEKVFGSYKDGEAAGRAEGLARAAEICQEMAHALAGSHDCGAPFGAPFEAVVLRDAAERLKAEAGYAGTTKPRTGAALRLDPVADPFDITNVLGYLHQYLDSSRMLRNQEHHGRGAGERAEDLRAKAASSLFALQAQHLAPIARAVLEAVGLPVPEKLLSHREER